MTTHLLLVLKLEARLDLKGTLDEPPLTILLLPRQGKYLNS